MDQVQTALSKATGEIVVGASRFFITDWTALNRLWKIGKENPKLVVRRFFHPGFHPKIFYFDKGPNAQVMIGSSNLTGGGLSGNVEANISVKGPREDQLFVAVRSFLQRLFDHSKPLNREFVIKYRRESSNQINRTPSSNRSDIREDTLPKSSIADTFSFESSRPRSETTWWKVAPGHDGSNWWRWKENITGMVGYISYGGSKYGNLRSVLDRSKEEALPLLEEKTRRYYQSSKPGREARQLWKFGKEIKHLDAIVAYSESTIYAIGEVVGRYEFRPEIDQRYPHTRRVRWWVLPTVRPPVRHLKILATNDTVHEILDKGTVRYLKNLVGTTIKRRI